MPNRKSTREIITKETIRRELLRESRHIYPLLIVGLPLDALCCAILIAAGFGTMPSRKLISEMVAESDPLLALPILLSFFSFLMAAALILIPLVLLTRFILRDSLIRGGKFSIVEDELVNMVRQEPYRSFYSRRTQYQDVFYFWKAGRYVVTGIDGSSFEYSSEGDTFYVVIIDSRHKRKNPNPPQRVYNAKIYQYEE